MPYLAPTLRVPPPQLRTPAALALAALLALVAASCGGGPEPEATRRPDVVFVLIDTLRVDRLPFLGHDEPTMPFLAEVASEGAVFEDMTSTSTWTAPSTASIFTGLYPTRHGVTKGFLVALHQVERGQTPTLELHRMPQDVPTLAELFQASGYQTYGLATNINIGGEIGFDRGFDRHERRRNQPAGELLATLREWKAAMDPERPRFVYLHLNDAHWPYDHGDLAVEPTETDTERLLEAYDAGLRYLDARLSEIHELLECDDDTLFVVASDHGEEFHDHGFLFHRFSLYRELNHALFVLRAPGLGVPAARFGQPVSNVDVLPTVLELAGLPAPAGRDGVSLVPLLRGGNARAALEASIADRPRFAHRESDQGEHLWSVTVRDWKLIEGPHGVELYDLASDPGEQRNVVPQNVETARKLVLLLRDFRERSAGAAAETTRIDLTDDDVERLRALGYAK